MNPLIFSTSVELVRVNPEHLVFISSDGNYSTLVLSDGESRVLTLFFRAVSAVSPCNFPLFLVLFLLFLGSFEMIGPTSERAIYNKGVQ